MSQSAQNTAGGPPNASIFINGSALGSELTQLLLCDQIVPGSEPSYEMCKNIYVSHPLGARLADDPIALAQSQRRDISVPDSPEEMVKEAFEQKWTELDLDNFIFGVVSTSRIYGIGSLIYGGIKKNGQMVPPSEPIDPWDLHTLRLYFSVADPLNTSGSLVLNQDPNSPDFQKAPDISISGEVYHSSRSVTMMNERPVYIRYTDSAFGFVGRSVYQRCLFPLKSFIRSMITDDMVVTKAGVLIAKTQQAGSITSNIMSVSTAVKRLFVKEAQTNNVISVGQDDSIETLNMMNIDGAFGMARKDILENIASSAPMPAVMLNGETFAEGFGEGTEDAKKVANYIMQFRLKMQKAYAFCDLICMYCAWSPDFYANVQEQFPDWKGVDYKTAFYRWKKSFKAEWPSLLIEPESEKADIEKVKTETIIAMMQVLLPELDPENKSIVLQWAAENMNALRILFTSPLMLDYDSFEAFVEDQNAQQKEMQQASLQEPTAPKPFAAAA
jgi:hypothetical protein